MKRARRICFAIGVLIGYRTLICGAGIGVHHWKAVI